MITAGVARIIFKRGKEDTLSCYELGEYYDTIRLALDYLATEEKVWGFKQARKNVEEYVKKNTTFRK